jgi:hypothetical protein
MCFARKMKLHVTISKISDEQFPGTITTRKGAGRWYKLL